MTIFFLIFFSRLSKSEMNWYGNDYARNRCKENESVYLPITILFDIFILFLFIF